MAETTLQIAHGFSTWHNKVPRWVLHHEGVIAPPRGRKLSATSLAQFLQAVASEGKVDANGNIVDIWGTEKLRRRCFRSRAQWWVYVKYAHEIGVMVTLARGGVLGAGQDTSFKKNIANTYGIPAHSGALDHARVHRREQTMRPTGRTGPHGQPVLAPSIDRDGDQATLFVDPATQPPPYRVGGLTEPHASQANPTGEASLPAEENQNNGVRPADYPRPPSGLPPSAEQTPPIPFTNPGSQNHTNHGGDGVRKHRQELPALTAKDLRDTGRMLELLPLYRRVWPKSFPALADPRLYLIAMAEHCLAKSTSSKGPGPMFIRNVSRGNWKFITEAAETSGQRRLKEHDRATAMPPERAAKPKKQAKLSGVEKKVLAALTATRCEPGEEVEAWRVVREQWPEIDRKAFDDAAERLLTSGRWRYVLWPPTPRKRERQR